MLPRPPTSTLFPYTTLFRSLIGVLHTAEFFDAGVPEGYRAALAARSEEHTSELQSPDQLVCRLLLENKNHSLTPLLSLFVYELPEVGRLARMQGASEITHQA